tara:strand:+ start:267 stop:596 length:330 start_codon:yes stop_codon:yes gene_type:complete
LKTIEKPWGYEIIWAETEDYVGKILHIEKNSRLSKQYHKMKEETVYVISGTLYNSDKDDNIVKIMTGESFHVFPGQVHRFFAKESAVRIVEVSTNYLEDVIRLQDDYKR